MAAAAATLAAAAALPDAPPAWLAAELAAGLGLAPAPPDDSSAAGHTQERPATPTASADRRSAVFNIEDAAGGREQTRRAMCAAGPGSSAGEQPGEAPGASDGHSVVGAHLAARARSLRGELSGVGPLARVCALRGLVAALPAAVLCAPLRWPAPSAPAPDSLGARCTGAGGGGGEQDADGSSGDGGNVELAGMCGTAGFGEQGVGEQGVKSERRLEAAEWTLLSDGALPAAVVVMAAAPDANFKYHAAQLLLVCLQRLEACLLVRSLPAVPGTRMKTAQARACLPAPWQLQRGVWHVHAVAGDASACLCRLQWRAARVAALLYQNRHPPLETPAPGSWQ